ncbi:helix-turn-helix transcriptional regulator [Epibacterium sp. Ofav1-8]|uniref:helix-turn-helix transcriptional regulator n=1 Tax=Epibacterium sp. Ofav1-8 TaxID=2917735 RepID=UPI001EF73CC5|nr:WYL domain-containing protein [Epibacterium sp. Ofav1-8]MCG7625239.1 WYL domain-containing protein [Epibacterium sp. Ofav1-8]
MTPRHRQDSILRILRRRGSTTVRALAHDVSASRRTILRDIAALRDEGYVIHADPGRGGGLCLDPGSVRATARLSVTEVFALVISVASMKAAGQLPFSGLADSGLAKIERSLPADKIRDLRRFLDCLYVGRLAPQVDISNLGPMDPALLPAFETAFLDRVLLAFRYRDAKGATSTRRVEPQAILVLPPLWYLVAWDPDRAAVRHFRMDRISAPHCIEGTRFQKRHVTFDDGVRPLR